MRQPRTAAVRCVIAFAALAATVTGATAMGPSLTDLPVSRTMLTCQQWAGSQNEEAIYLWGLLETGKTSEDVGRLRLALVCLGDRKPDIVDFGASVGSAEQYCMAHPRVQICRNRR